MATMTPDVHKWLDNVEEEARGRRDEAQEIIDAVKLVRAFYKDTREASPPEVVRHEIIKVLETYGEPLHRREIAEMLESVDVYPRGKDPVATVSSILSRYDGDFRAYGGGKWGLLSWSNPDDNGSPPRGEATAVPVAGNPEPAHDDSEVIPWDVPDKVKEMAAKVSKVNGDADDLPW